MIPIVKAKTPEATQALNTFLKKEGEKAHYTNFKQSDGKDAVQKSLLEEQGYLCAYCMRRIHEAEKIEHWATQEASKDNENAHETLDYNNMLAVCNGKTKDGTKSGQAHCDQSRSKSNRALTINPIDPIGINQIRHLKNGTIYSKDNAINDDLNLDNS
ncbi:MAG: hypothetical protein RLZZ292_2319, partial [Bacteroidota bacterium]